MTTWLSIWTDVIDTLKYLFTLIISVCAVTEKIIRKRFYPLASRCTKFCWQVVTYGFKIGMISLIHFSLANKVIRIITRQHIACNVLGCNVKYLLKIHMPLSVEYKWFVFHRNYNWIFATHLVQRAKHFSLFYGCPLPFVLLSLLHALSMCYEQCLLS